jgi:hypothetical protein
VALVVLAWLAASGTAMAGGGWWGWHGDYGWWGCHGTAHIDCGVYGPPRHEVYSSPYLWAPSYSEAYTYGVLVAPGYPAHSPTLPAYTWYYGPISPSPAIW